MPKKLTKEDALKLLHEIADGASPDIIRAFVKAVSVAQDEVSIRRLTTALKANDIESAWKTINWDFVMKKEFLPVLASTIREVMELSGAETAKELLKNAVSFDILNPAVTDFIKRESGDLITLVSQQTKNAIRDIIQTGYREGKSITQMADQIRDYGIGLNARQARAFENFRANLTEKGITGPAADKQLTRYYNRLIKERATMIAQTETIKAANEGWRQQINQAVAEGLIDPSEWEAGWIVIDDEKACTKCESMNGKTRPLGGNYYDGAYKNTEGPPQHVNCRCCEGMQRKEMKQVA